ncbi:GAF domain-containing protein [Chloroflexota bacterium]
MKHKNTIRYTMIGVVFGLCFPIFGTIIGTYDAGIPLTFENFGLVQAESYLLWIINTAPVFLGIFAGFAGFRQDKLAQQYLILKTEISARRQAVGEIESLKNNFDQEIIERTLKLETATEVSHYLSTILEQGQLVREAVDQIQESFGAYHTQIYLFDDENENLKIVGGTGDVGKLLLEHGHSIPKGHGLVGRAGDTNLPILVADVSQDDGWLPNPLLPNTKAEAAIPIAVEDQMLGVLDVQEDEIDGLIEEDVDLLQTIANQIATALQNAQLYHHAEEKVSRETRLADINRKILSTTDVEGAMQIAAREIGRALGCATRVSLNVNISNNGQKQ